MDEDMDMTTIAVRADVSRFARDVAEMRASLEGPLVAGADRAGAVGARDARRTARAYRAPGR